MPLVLGTIDTVFPQRFQKREPPHNTSTAEIKPDRVELTHSHGPSDTVNCQPNDEWGQVSWCNGITIYVQKRENVKARPDMFILDI